MADDPPTAVATNENIQAHTMANIDKDTREAPDSNEEVDQAESTSKKPKNNKRIRRNRKKKNKKQAEKSGDVDREPEPMPKSATAETVLDADSAQAQHPTSAQPAKLQKAERVNCPQIPAGALFALHALKGGDEEDEGLFATADIKAGTRLIYEKPIIALTASEVHIGDIMNAYDNLSPADQDAVWGLKPTAAPELHPMSQHTDALVKVYLDLHAKGDSMSERETNVYKWLEPRLHFLTRAWRIGARFHAHRYSLVSSSPSERERVPSHIPVTGLFILAARLRHSCIPNCCATYNHTTGHMTVHAVKPIAAGAELNISHLGQQVWYHRAQDRARMLRETPTLPCACDACDPQSPEHEKQDRIRQRLYVNVAFLSHTLTHLDALHRVPLYGRKAPSVLAGMEQHIDRDHLEDTESKCLDTIRLLSEAGCTDMEIVRWRNALVMILLPALGKWEPAVAHAKLAVRAAEMCWGADHPDLEPLEKAVRASEREVLENEKRAAIQASKAGKMRKK